MQAVQYTAYLQGSLKLSKEGQWFHNGKAFENAKIAELFHRSIVWSENQYFVQIGPQRATFDLEDTAYFVAELLDDSTPWRIRLVDQRVETLNVDSLEIGQSGQIYCCLDNQHRARFTRQAYQHLVQHLVDEFTLEVAGKRVRIGGA